MPGASHRRPRPTTGPDAECDDHAVVAASGGAVAANAAGCREQERHFLLADTGTYGLLADTGTYGLRVTIVRRLAGLIDTLQGDRVLIAFDGPDAAGKTTLAHAVAEHLSRPAIRASVDGWHNPREVRLRRGDESPEGYYLDSFDLDALARDLLTPFKDGARDVRPVGFDCRTDTAVQVKQPVPGRAALLFDGVFLLRPELLAWWNLRIYLHVPEEVTLSRAVVRDIDQFGHALAVQRRYQRRYMPGQTLYRDTASPLQVADVVLDNSDWNDPVVVRWPKEG
jgi:uridine kinase